MAVKKRMDKNNRGILLSVIALLTIMLAAVIDVPAYAQPEGTGNVHGTVVDEAGRAFRKVKVMAYSSSGSLVASKNTDSDGFFRFALDSGSYTIVFEKEGYARVQKSISVPTGFVADPENDPVKLGEIVLKKALRLSASVLSRVANPGDTMLFPFAVSNIGEEPEDIQFSVVGPAGWGTRVLDSTAEITRVLLAPGSLNLYLEVDVPLKASETGIISITAMGKTDATLGFTIVPKTSFAQEIELKSSYLSVSEELGRTIYFPLTITNEGEIDEIVDLMGAVPSGWSISFVTGTGMAVQSLYLTPGESETLNIKVVPSEGAPVGGYIVVVDAVSEGDVLRDSLELKVNLREATSDVKVISTFTDITVEAGKTINFPITIWNKGETDALFLLTVLSVPENWKTVFTSEDIEISSVLVTAGESLRLQLEVTPPSNVDTGAYQIIVYTESDDGLITKQIDLKVSIVGSYALGLELSTLYTTVTIGRSVTFTATVRNTGQSPITSLYLETALPEGWDSSIAPVQVSSLAPRESTTFTLMADTPADTVAGDYLITVQAMGDQTESNEADLRVTAKASTSWGFIGIGLAAVFVIGLAVVFMRFKRR
ncbi:hypothetical protein AC482_04885 [miscellaneous Crenarchaeota group-15 archaeon DG-45]|uniref:Alpha-galactosidase NEW3 domain-containing protein n=1 Tax=miscellaneous Crenarchaeota group-15 archaeon DG-45 TaxID=1685127 RepID=A0A0M0BP21_9ARCH|nr:MAG: hypothetical protein AC482_04885 [miscellaneous Crenarchaeota group-15 archaeon DG-45]